MKPKTCLSVLDTFRMPYLWTLYDLCNARKPWQAPSLNFGALGSADLVSQAGAPEVPHAVQAHNVDAQFVACCIFPQASSSGAISHKLISF